MNQLRNYNDHTKYLTDAELRLAEKRADEKDVRFQRGEGNGQGDWETFFSKEVRQMRWSKP